MAWDNDGGVGPLRAKGRRGQAVIITGRTEDIGWARDGTGAAWDATGGRGATEGAFWDLYKVDEQMEGFADPVLFI